MRRPSFPTVISLIALFVALGGTSYAVIKLPAKAVGARELKSNAVTSGKIRDRSIRTADLSPLARTGPRGPRGPAGPSGGSGATGDVGAPEPWKPLAFVSPWSSYGSGYASGAFRKDQHGQVFLRGLVHKDPGGPAQGDVIAVLPAGYRPSATLAFSPSTGGSSPGDPHSRIQVLATGEVQWISGAGGEIDFTSLDEVSFWTD
jgi:hypothetical protein